MNDLVNIYPENIDMDRTSKARLAFTIKNNDGYLEEGVLVTLSLDNSPFSGRVLTWYRFFNKSNDDMVFGTTNYKGEVVFELLLDKGLTEDCQGVLKSTVSVDGELMINSIPYTILV